MGVHIKSIDLPKEGEWLEVIIKPTKEVIVDTIRYRDNALLKTEYAQAYLEEENDMETKPVQQGWQCPICGRILSPWTWECPCGGNGRRYTTSDRTDFKAEWTNKDALETHKGAGEPKW